MDLMKIFLPPIDKNRTLQLSMRALNRFLKLAKASFFHLLIIVGRPKYFSGLIEILTPRRSPICTLTLLGTLLLKKIKDFLKLISWLDLSPYSPMIALIA